jgi:hypothetical protein
VSVVLVDSILCDDLERSEKAVDRAEKLGHFGGIKGTSAWVTLWPGAGQENRLGRLASIPDRRRCGLFDFVNRGTTFFILG